MSLEDLTKQAFFFITEHGSFASGETVSERGKYAQDARHFARDLAHYFRDDGRKLLAHLGKEPDYIAKNFKGTGSVRISDSYGQGRDVAATFMGLGYIVSNGFGNGWSEGLDKFAASHGLSCNEAKEYVLSHETVHFTGTASESQVEAHLHDYFMKRAGEAKTKESRAKYLRFASIAQARQRAYRSMEGNNDHAQAKARPAQQSWKRNAQQQNNKPVPHQQYRQRPTYQKAPSTNYASQKSQNQNYKRAALI